MNDNDTYAITEPVWDEFKEVFTRKEFLSAIAAKDAELTALRREQEESLAILRDFPEIVCGEGVQHGMAPYREGGCLYCRIEQLDKELAEAKAGVEQQQSAICALEEANASLAKATAALRKRCAELESLKGAYSSVGEKMKRLEEMTDTAQDRGMELMEENEALRKRCAEAESAIKWALGEGDFFPTRKEGEGSYWWRKELRARAGSPQYHYENRTLKDAANE